MTLSAVRRTLRALVLVALPACAPFAQAAPPAAPTVAPTGPWIDLQRADAWRGYRMDSLPSGWVFDAASGELTRLAGTDIITRQAFNNFVLELEWRVAPRGNSGIFFWAQETTDRIFENATEMQVLDNAGHPDGRSALTSAGANFGLYPTIQSAAKPAGEWNAVQLVARGNHVEHWLNGQKVAEYVLGSPEWAAKVQATKFAQWPSYGRARRGHIGLQDHGDVVSFRRMRIRELP